MKLSFPRKNSLKWCLTMLLMSISCFSFSQVKDVSIEDLQMKNYAKDTSAGAVIMFDIGTADLDMVYNDFVMKYTKHIRIKFFNETELDWANVEIPFYYDKTGDKEKVKIKNAITYNLVDGNIQKTSLGKKDFIEENTSDYYKQIKFAFADVKPGSIVEYEYELTSPFKSVKTWYFQHTIPVIYSEKKTELASFWQYKMRLKSYETPVLDTFYIIKSAGTCTFSNRQSKMIEYEYDKAVTDIIFKNVPAFYYEDDMKCKEDYISKVDFQLEKYDVPGFVEKNILKTWEEVASELSDRYDLDKHVKITDELKEQLEGQSLNSEEKTKKILRYVQNEYSWNGKNSINASQDSKDLQKTKSGNSADINLHLIRMLRQNGVNAYPLILSTSSNGRLNYDMPFIDQFNYVLPLVADDKGVFFCDATLKCAPYYLIPSKCLNGYGFLVDKEKAQFVQMMDISQTSSDYQVTCNFKPSMDSVILNIQLSAFGYDAMELREYLYDKDIKSVKEKLFPGEKDIKFTYDGNIKNEDYTKPLNLSFTVTKEVLARNGKIYFNPFVIEKIKKNPFLSDERNYPIDFRYKKNKTIRVTMTIPQGYSLESFPEAKNSETSNGEVKYTYEAKSSENTIQAIAEYKIDKPEVKADNYFELKNIFNDIIFSQDGYFVISKQE